MPAGSFWSARVALLAELDTEPFGVAASEPTMVDVDEDRLKVFARGARCVSLSFFVNFQLIVAGLGAAGGGGGGERASADEAEWEADGGGALPTWAGGVPTDGYSGLCFSGEREGGNWAAEACGARE
jgi:hypothetical protein